MLRVKDKFVLLDRDGVINRHIVEGYVTSSEQFEFLPWSLQALRLLADHGFKVLVVSNQACVGKGLLTEQKLARITYQFMGDVAASGGSIGSVYYCTHRADQRCSCRKPRVGLLLKAQAEHHFHFDRTFVVGDSTSDIMAARSVGAPAILVSSGMERKQSAAISGVKTVTSLYEAAEFIIASALDDVSNHSGLLARALG